MKKIVVIGDIVSSKQIINRSQVQEKLADVLRKLNTKKNSSLVSPYTITLGDEFQAVFNNADNLFYDALLILLSVYPVQIRFSFGIGIIETPIYSEQALGMDGPAFYNARTGIVELKRKQYLFDITGLDNPYVGLSRQSLYLISHIFRKWNKNRLQVLVMLYEKIPAKDIATAIHVSDKAIYKTIETGALRIIIQLFEEITKILNNSLEIK